MTKVLRIEKQEDLGRLPDNYILVFIKKKTFRNKSMEIASWAWVDVDLGFFSQTTPPKDFCTDLTMYDISYVSDIETALLLFNVYDAMNMARNIKRMSDNQNLDLTKYDNRRIQIEM